jgi:hypothetical protein
LAVIGAALSIGVIVARWWNATRPERLARKRKEQNVEIHNQVATRDMSALRKLLRRLRAGKS